MTATGQVSGAERVLLGVLRAAVESGWSVRCLAPPGAIGAELDRIGVSHRPLPELGRRSGVPGAVTTAAAWALAAARIRRAARSADVVLVNSLTALPSVRLARPRAPAVWLSHDVLIRPDRLRLFRMVAPGLTRVIAVSHAAAAPLRGHGVPVEVVLNGIDASQDEVGEPGAESDEGRVIGISAVLTPWKGHGVLLDAVDLLPADVQVELLGGQLIHDVEYAEAIRTRAASWPGGRVRALGHVDDPQRRMRNWTVSVSASIEPEACPLAVLEAMALGIPVVATDHGGAPEVLDGAGVLVPPGDPAALAAGVIRLLDDPARRAELAARGRERIATAHQPTRQRLAVLEALAEVADGIDRANEAPGAMQRRDGIR